MKLFLILTGIVGILGLGLWGKHKGWFFSNQTEVVSDQNKNALTELSLEQLINLTQNFNRTEINSQLTNKGFSSTKEGYYFDGKDGVAEQVIIPDSANMIEYMMTSKNAYNQLMHSVYENEQEELSQHLPGRENQIHYLIKGSIFVPCGYSLNRNGYIVYVLPTNELVKLTQNKQEPVKKDTVSAPIYVSQKDTTSHKTPIQEKPTYPITAYISVNSAEAYCTDGGSDAFPTLTKGMKVIVLNLESDRYYCDFNDKLGKARTGLIHKTDISFSKPKTKEKEDDFVELKLSKD